MITDLSIFIAMTPLAFLAFESMKRLKNVLLLLSLSFALAAHAHSFWLASSEPLSWLPAAMLLALAALESVLKKQFRILLLLGVLFSAQALLCKNLLEALLLIIFSDIFLSIEEGFSESGRWGRIVRGLLLSFFAYMPLVFAMLLKRGSENLILGVFLTIILRTFSWPFFSWPPDKQARGGIFPLCAGPAAAFALWRLTGVDPNSLWSAFWMITALVLSVGAAFDELAVAISLGLFNLSPFWGAAGILLWPLFIFRGRMSYVLCFAIAAVGGLVASFQPPSFDENTLYALVGLLAVSLARRAVVFTDEARLGNKWHDMLGLATALGFGAALFILSPGASISMTLSGGIFSGIFLCAYGAGAILIRKRRPIFSGPRSVPTLESLFRPWPAGESTPPAIKGKALVFRRSTGREKFFRFMESETNIALLLGLLGVVLIWGLK